LKFNCPIHEIGTLLVFDGLNLEDGTEKAVIINLHYVTSQKSEDLISTAAEA
jgi:hypothetical protein